MTTHPLHDLQSSYSQHQHFNHQLQISKTNIVKEASYLGLPMLEGHQLQNVTSCIPTSLTNLSITYTMVTTIEMQTSIIRVMISKSLQEVLKLDLY